MTNSNLRVRPSFWGRLVGEISTLRNTWPSGWGFQYMSPYRLDSSRVNYTLARELYRNINDRYKLGAGFSKPVIDTTAGFMGAPHFTHSDPDLGQILNQDMGRFTGKILRINRNTLRDGDQFVRLSYGPAKFGPSGSQEFQLQLIPPEWCTPVPDPITGSWQSIVIRYPCQTSDDQGRLQNQYTIVETLTPTSRVVTVEGAPPPGVRETLGRTEDNPWGFIPIVHFKNEAEETQLFGMSELEAVEPFMKAYHDTLLFAVQGSKYFSRPKVKFKLADVNTFMKNNFTPEEISSGKLRFADREIFMLQGTDDADFISADSGLEGITTLLKFLFYCIVDTSQTPEFAFGTAVSSSKASVSEQMTPLARKIRRKRGLFEEAYGELASMYLAMWAKINNRVLDTYRVDINWDELSQRNDKEVADTINALTQGLIQAIDGGILSVHSAADFLREFIPSMLPWVDKNSRKDEKRRVVESAVFRDRLADISGLTTETETEEETTPPAGD